jgi:NADPH:quinone reductase-like Zn-dependent oxidoreductase
MAIARLTARSAAEHPVKAIFAAHPEPKAPLDALRYSEQPEPAPVDADWTTVTVHAASLNHHDLFMLRGAGARHARYPLILGCEGAGVDDTGREVIVGGFLCAPQWRQEPMLDPRRTTLGEGAPGTFAERVAVPRQNLVDKPPGWSFAEASCLWATWLAAYRMLFTKGELRPGDTVLVQGASGGLSTALIRLAASAGIRVWATSRTPASREHAVRLGSEVAVASGARLPAQVDAVMESVGAATWSHSIRWVRPGGIIVVGGATTGAAPPAHLTRVFWQELRVVGSAAGTAEETVRLLRFMDLHRLRPEIGVELPFADAHEGFRRMIAGQLTGKIVFGW